MHCLKQAWGTMLPQRARQVKGGGGAATVLDMAGHMGLAGLQLGLSGSGPQAWPREWIGCIIFPKYFLVQKQIQENSRKCLQGTTKYSEMSRR
jgi:hypothetical protein